MAEKEDKMKIVFAPGCFDDLDIEQEELDLLVAELEAMVKDGTIFDNAVPIEEDFDVHSNTIH